MLDTFVYIGVFGILAMSLNLEAGFTRLTNFGKVGFFGIGAYTAALLASVPIPDPRLRATRAVLEGEVANPANPPAGCHFNPRCAYAVDKCRTDEPQLEQISPGRWVSCHRADEIELAGLAGVGSTSKKK